MTTLQYSQDFESLVDYAKNNDFGELHHKLCPKTGLQAVIAIHSTKLGPALGGCRFIHYPTSIDAVYDAMKLAKGMSYKAAMTGLPLGGGKAVIIKPEGHFDRTAYLGAFAKFVENLGGKYITAVDSGTTIEDMDYVRQKTKYVASISNNISEPSNFTAKGVMKGIEAALHFQGGAAVKDTHVLIQGLGQVGFKLANLLYQQGAKLTVSDTNSTLCQKAEEAFKAKVVSPEQCATVACDIYAPCALGGTINKHTVEHIKAKIVAGAANNQLAKDEYGAQLKEQNILYVPDFVINAGGLIFAAGQYLGLEHSKTVAGLNSIYESVLLILNQADKNEQTPETVANKIAKERLAYV